MRKTIVISDFDGTITTRDSLVEILDRFASPEWRKVAHLVKNGSLGTRIGLKKEFDLCRTTKKEFVDFILKNIRIDRTFKKFLHFCEKNRIKFVIVSGGFTLNMKTLLKKYAINVPYYGNIVTFGGKGVKVRFPYNDKTCRACSHCKAPRIREYIKKGYFTIYIGDSVTDRCPARVADLVFAKHDLIEYCEENGIDHVPYDNFGNIQAYLKKYLRFA